MILAASELRRSIREGVRSRIGTKDAGTYPLIENVPSDFEIEGSSIDFSLERVWRISDGYAFLGKNKRNTGSIIEVLPEDDNIFDILPGIPYICLSREIVNMPTNLIAFPNQRVTCFSAGLSIETGVIQPNFYGKLKFGLYNRNKHTVFIEKGFRMITVTFHLLFGETNIYNGYHQGGNNISTNGDFAPPR